MARRRSDRDRALYVISVAAELAGVHPQTLRIYERKGLIEPSRTAGRSRRYSERDIALLLRIQELTNEGVSLAGVQQDPRARGRARRGARRDRGAAAALAGAASGAGAPRSQQVHRSYRRDLVPGAERRRQPPPLTRRPAVGVDTPACGPSFSGAGRACPPPCRP